MEVEEIISNAEESTTPELDEDVPPKGIPRLVIEKMVLQNFKSYAGEHVIGPFHKCFTSVVGPNGSGKSNVIDALLFVFGNRASKLRLKKLSELIHNSANVAPCQFARVSVYFQDIIDIDDDKFEIVPDSSFTVSRTAYQNGSSKYFLNDNVCSPTELTTLLRKRGIDLDNNRFLILQGEVEQISLMKPKKTTGSEDGLLEYLEDIIGSAKYVTMIEDKEVEVEKLNESRGEVLNRVKVVEKERNTLEAGKKEADLYLAKERELAREQALLYQYYLYESGKEEIGLNCECEKTNTKLSEIHSSLQEYMSRLSSMDAEFKKMNEEYECMNTELQRCKDEYDVYERKDIQYHENMKAQKANLKKMRAKQEANTSLVDEKTSSVEKMGASLIRLENDVEAALEKKESAKEALTQMLTRFKEEITRLKAKKSEIETSLHPLEERFAVQDSSLQEKKTEVDMIISRRNKYEKEIGDLHQFIDSQTSILNEKMRDIEQKRVEIAHKASEIDQLKEQKTRCEQDISSTSQELKRKREILQERRSVVSEKQNSSGVLNTLRDAARPQGELANVGFCGRLGDLGEIDAYYDVAASTASSALDYVVVETAEDAQRCIEYLKKYNVGRSRFLILEKMQRKYVNAVTAPFTCPPNSKRLFDLISVDEKDKKYLPAFYFAFTDTLVTTSLDIASSIAYSKKSVLYRVVTTSGQIIEKSGTMTGGGRSNRHGLMRLRDETERRRSNADEASLVPLETLEGEVDVLNKRYDTSAKELSEMKSSILLLEDTLPKLRLEVSKLEIDVAALRNTIDKRQKELDVASQEFQKMEADLPRKQQLEICYIIADNI